MKIIKNIDIRKLFYSLVLLLFAICVDAAPTITAQPQSQSIGYGQSVTLKVSAAGKGTLTYKWYRDKTLLSSQTKSTLTETVYKTHTYYVDVTDSAGTTRSSTATVTVYDKPTITTKPDYSQSVGEGGTINFSVVATGGGTLFYRWYKEQTQVASGNDYTSYTISNAKASDAGNYSVKVSNDAGEVSYNWYLFVNSKPVDTKPSITTQPIGKNVTEGNLVTFSVGASGTSPLSYQWYKNGTTLSGANNTSYMIRSVQTSDAGSYTVKVTNSLGSVTSNAAELTVNAASADGPVITVQPQSQTVNEGSSVTFSVEAENAAGADPDVNIELIRCKAGTFTMGSPTYELGRTSDDEAQHQVTISKDFWMGKYEVTQEQYQAIMGKNPSHFVGDNYPVEKYPVETVSWNEAMDFCAKLTAIKRKAGDLPDGYEYTLPTEEQWEYACRAGTTTAFNMGRNIPQQSMIKNVCYWGEATKTTYGWITSPGTVFLSSLICYHWSSFDYLRSSHSPVSSFNINNWNFYNMHGNVAEWCLNKVLRGGGWDSYAGECRSASRVPSYSGYRSNSVGFRVALVPSTSSGPSTTDTLTYQWYKNGAKISGATGASYRISSVRSSDEGNYSVVVSNGTASTTSETAVLTVRVKPGITTQPKSQTVTEGNPVTFSVTTSGTAPLSYQWYKNGVTLTGATSSSYTISSVKTSDAGNYTVTVSNSLGSVTSSTATLTVDPKPVPPTITKQPQSQTVTEGSYVTFMVSATGTTPLSYQWYKNGTKISGAIGVQYGIGIVKTSDAGNYTVTVSNSAGSVTSSVATLTVTPSVTLSSISISGNSSVNEGSTATYTCTATYSNGTTKTVTPVWSVSPTSYATITSGGVLTGKSAGTVTITASYTEGGVTRTATKSVTVNPNISYHPADTNKDQMIKITEVTAYGGAWKKGESWSVAPNPIPISYVTRAGALWKNGEVYTQNKSKEAPLCWENVTAVSAAAASAQCAISGTKVTITVTPDSGVSVYAVEDTIPSGWSVTGINESGVFDSANRKVKWGPWFDNSPRTLTYTLVVPSGFSGTATLSGTVSFDGVDVAITGDRQYGKSSGKAVSKISGNQVTITVTPDSGVSSYAVEDNIPSGLSVTGINESGVFDSANRKVKWGPWFDNATRTLTYTLVPGSFTGTATLSGTASFDGVDTAITGDRKYTVSPVVKPAITTQPKSQTVNEGSSVTFSVVASGTTPLSYQWYKGSTKITGATSASYKISSVKTSDAGSYKVTVSNSAGSVTSSVAKLTVNVPVTLSSISISGSSSVNVGSTATYTCIATYSNGTTNTVTPTWSISSGTSYASITSGGVLTGRSSGTATITASYSGKTATKNVTVTAPVVKPTITTQPKSQTVNEGGSVTFSVTATGTATLKYQWKKNGTAISGATSSTYKISSVKSSDAGSYTVTVSNSAGSVTSSAATLTVNPVVIDTITINGDSSVDVGSTVTYTCTVKYSNGTSKTVIPTWSVSPTTYASITSAGVLTGKAVGTVTLKATYTEGGVTKVVTKSVTVKAGVVKPSITTQPKSQTVTEGNSVTFSVVATGTATLKYQWKKNGTAISGATSSSYKISSVKVSDEGSYTVTVSNSAGSVTSSAAALTVNPVLMLNSITIFANGTSLTVGRTTSLICKAYYNDGTTKTVMPIWSISSGINYASIDNEGNLTGDAAGTVVVQAKYTEGGVIKTATKTITIVSNPDPEPKPVITTQPKSQTVTEDSSVTFIVGSTTSNVSNGNKVVPLSSSVNLDMVWIKPGSFTMGSPDGELGRRDNETPHQVAITEGYWLGKYEVTQEQYRAVMGNNPSKFNGNRLPVEKVTWANAMEFCARLTEQEKAAGRLPAGYEYTLPTEAQWEYACRAGTTTELNSGKNLTSEENCPNMDQVGWYVSNSNATTKAVGQKQPNAWGLYDMHGNVWEWCLDWKGDYSLSAVIDPVGPNEGIYKTLRGGSWNYTAGYCRSAIRGSIEPAKSNSYTGFRVALSAVEKSKGLNYQWYKDGKAISGATKATYTISNAKASDAGSYTVTVSNSAGSVTSSAATLKVVSNSISIRQENYGTKVTITFTGTLQESSDMKTWKNVTTQSPYTTSVWRGQKFYRSVQ